jgi:hypothetical protein
MERNQPLFAWFCASCQRRLANSRTTSRRQKSANPEADAFRDDDARACIRSYLIAGGKGKGKVVFP